VNAAPARASVYLVGLAAAVALLGDSTLYAVLPIEAKGLGLTAIQVGILLSANRLIRILVNTPTSVAISHYGPRRPLMGALLLAAITTLATGHAAGVTFAGFLVARLAWGLAWSFIRNSGNTAVLASAAGRGELFGWLKAFTRLGSLAGVVAGAWLVDRFGFVEGYDVLALATLPGILLAAIAVPRHGAIEVAPPLPASTPPVRVVLGGRGPGLLGLGIASILSHATGTSLLVATASLRVKDLVGTGTVTPLFGVVLGVVTVCGIAGSGRWIAEIVVTPIAGRAADRIGRVPVIFLGGNLSAAALFLCSRAPTPTAFVAAVSLAFVAQAILQTGVDALAIDRAQAFPRTLVAFSSYVLASDVGTALGPLLGPVLAESVGLPAIYVTGGIVAAGIAFVSALPHGAGGADGG
jgi:MFS family permease